MAQDTNVSDTWQVELSLSDYDTKSGAVYLVDNDKKKYFSSMKHLERITEVLGRRIKKHTDIFLCTVKKNQNKKYPRVVSFDRLPDK